MMIPRCAGLLLALTVSLQAGAEQLFPGEVILAGSSFVASVGADFNDDGRPDLAVVDSPSSDIRVLINTGSGGFSEAGRHRVGTTPRVIVSGDFNKDGNPDLAVANDDSNNVSVLLGDGAGSFSAVQYYYAGDGLSLVSADFNGDGNPDLAVRDALLLGDGLGGFSVQSYAAISGASLASGDFDGDGNADLARVQYLADLVNVALGDGTGAFADPVAYGSGDAVAGLTTREIVSADLNDDGYSDLVVTDTASDSVMVMLADGAGGFAPVARYGVGRNPSSITIADINADRRPDLVVGNYGSSDVSVLLGSSTGAFSAATNYAAGFTPRVHTVGDFNGDGNPDLVVGDTGLRLLLGDGVGGFVVATNYAVGSAAGYLASGDFNGDGFVDLVASNAGTDANDPGHVSLLLGDGVGGFAPAVDFQPGSKPGPVLAADFNGDANADLMVLNEASYDVSLLLSDGLGGFSAPVTYLQRKVSNVMAAADFDGDGNVDVAVAHDGGLNETDISILRGDGAGGFTVLEHDFGLALWHVAAMVSGDFNGDGDADLAVAGVFGTRVLFGDGAGGLTAGPVIAGLTAWATGNYLASADFDADGFLDLAVAVAGDPGEVRVALGDGAGNFPTSAGYAAGAWPLAIASADLNTDGYPDLVVSGQLNSLGVLLGDGAGGFSLAPTSAAVGAMPRAVVIADFDGNGRQDVAVTGNGIWLDFLGLQGARESGFVTVMLNHPTPADPTLPVGRIVIDHGDVATNTVAVTLSLTCTDDLGCTRMQFSNDGVNWGDWLAYAPNAEWTLAAGTDGLRTVYARFGDGDDNVSVTASDRIMLDTEAPVITLLGADPLSVAQGTVFVDPGVTVTDNVDTGLGATVSGVVDTTVEGSYTLTYTATDTAGNQASTQRRVVVTEAATVSPGGGDGGGGGIGMLAIALLLVIARCRQCSPAGHRGWLPVSVRVPGGAGPVAFPRV